MSIIYLADRKRRPVWVGTRPGLQDIGGEIPYGWCSRCGMECYMPGKALCPACEEKENFYGKTDEISLQTVQAGGQSPAVRE